MLEKREGSLILIVLKCHTIHAQIATEEEQSATIRYDASGTKYEKNVARLLPLYNTLKSFSVSFCVILNDKYSQTNDHFAKRLY